VAPEGRHVNKDGDANTGFKSNAMNHGSMFDIGSSRLAQFGGSWMFLPRPYKTGMFWMSVQGCIHSASWEEHPAPAESLIESFKKRAKRTPGYGLCTGCAVLRDRAHGCAARSLSDLHGRSNSNSTRSAPSERRATGASPLGHASSPSMGSLGRRRPAGSRSQAELPARPRPASQPLRGLTSSRLLLQRILASLMHRFGFTVQYLQIPDCYYLNSGQAFRKLHFGAISHGFTQQRPGDRGIDGDEPLGGIGLIHTYDAVIDLPFR